VKLDELAEQQQTMSEPGTLAIDLLEFAMPDFYPERERVVYRLNELPSEIAEAIRASRMDSSYDYLNALLEDERRRGRRVPSSR
jgi:hypothetical protein